MTRTLYRGSILLTPDDPQVLALEDAVRSALAQGIRAKQIQERARVGSATITRLRHGHPTNLSLDVAERVHAALKTFDAIDPTVPVMPVEVTPEAVRRMREVARRYLRSRGFKGDSIPADQEAA